MTDHAPHNHHDHHDALAEILDLDAKVFAPALRAVHEDIDRAADSPVRSIVDIGAGTGTGTFGLLRHFTQARAVAVDSSADMLAHLGRQAERLGVADRVSTRQADLDVAVPVIGPVDLVWAAASLHHLAEPDRTLPEIAATLRLGGLLVVAELDGFPRFVPDSTPGGAAEARAHALMAADRAVDMPTMGSDWGTQLEEAGLVVELSRPILVDLAPPLPPAVGRYAAATLARVRGAVADRLTTVERQAFDALLDGGPDDVRRRPDLRVRAQRWLWITRRPRLAS